VPTCPAEVRDGEVWVRPIFGHADPAAHWRQGLDDGLAVGADGQLGAHFILSCRSISSRSFGATFSYSSESFSRKPRIHIGPSRLIASIAKWLIQKHSRARPAFDLVKFPDCADQCIPDIWLPADGFPNRNRCDPPEPHIDTGVIVPQTKTKFEADMPQSRR
jgi:hypothetical protein